MKVLISGSHGLVGSALCAALEAAGDQVSRLVRGEGDAPGQVPWQPAAGDLDHRRLAAFDAVVHLAGEPIAGGRWNARKKARIRDSRVRGTRLLAESLSRLETPPSTLVCASAIGFYGDRGDRLLDEESTPGEGFLADVCQRWEAAAEPARHAGLRVVNLRFGVVLAAGGGALAAMLTPFRLGLGGVVGSGRQWVSWIHLDDAVGAVRHALGRSLHGPLNAVAPAPVTQRQLTRTLGAVLRRPTWLPLPAPVARLAFGEMADALLLASTRVDAGRLLGAGYSFAQPALEPALRDLLGPR